MGDGEGRQIEERELAGLKYFKDLLPLFNRLREVGCQRDKAGNRRLHMDQYCMLVLLFLFNPIVTSLRSLQQASALKKVQRKLGCPRTSLGSLSEAAGVFDPALLEPIVAELLGRVPKVRDAGRGQLAHALTAVDGSVVKTLSTIAQAAYLKNRFGESLSAWRLHTHFSIDSGVPTRIDVTRGVNSGKSDEKNVLRSRLEPDHCYVTDRWFSQHQLFNDIHALGSSYVCRVRDNAKLDDVIENRQLSPQAPASGRDRRPGRTLGRSSQAGRPPGADRAREDDSPRRPRPPRRRQERFGQRRPAALGHQPIGSAGRDHRRGLPPSLADRDVLPVLQAHPRLPASLEP
jgi:hypothetical protein